MVLPSVLQFVQVPHNSIGVSFTAMHYSYMFCFRQNAFSVMRLQTGESFDPRRA